jgi:hypothetical protein
LNSTGAIAARSSANQNRQNLEFCVGTMGSMTSLLGALGVAVAVPTVLLILSRWQKPIPLMSTAKKSARPSASSSSRVVVHGSGPWHPGPAVSMQALSRPGWVNDVLESTGGHECLLFSYVQKLHGKSPWGRFLDAGTGDHSLGWVSARSLLVMRINNSHGVGWIIGSDRSCCCYWY